MKIHLMNDRKLKTEFDHLNERFFRGKIVLNHVGYAGKSMVKGASGAYFRDEKKILLDSDLRKFPNLSCVILLHEMAHAHLELQDYSGYPMDAGHGMRFQVELDRIYREGGYDGLL